MPTDDTLEFVRVVALTPSTTSPVLLAQLQGLGADGAAEEDQERFDGCEVVQPAGLISRPAVSEQTEAVALRRGDELVALFLVDKSRAAQAVEAGEARLHGVGSSNGTTVIRIRNNGNIEITAAGTSEVSVNGGTLKVARVTDPVRVGTLTGTAGPYPLALTFTPLDADGAPGAPSTGPSVTLTGVVSNAGGASRFKG